VELLAGIDVMLFPSVPEGEGMPGVLIEAGLAGVPVVATDVPGASTVIDDGVTGVVVGVDDFTGMVEAAADLVRDPSRRREMGTAARERCAARFSMDASARRWEAM